MLSTIAFSGQYQVPKRFFNKSVVHAQETNNFSEPLQNQPQQEVVVEPAAKVETKATEPTPQPVIQTEPVVQPEPKPIVAERPVEVYHSDDFYMEYIFQHESSGNPHARNHLGCLGLGQACPGTKLLTQCPDLGEVACQVRFFTNYAVSRYGSWANAYNFWTNNHWW